MPTSSSISSLRPGVPMSYLAGPCAKDLSSSRSMIAAKRSSPTWYERAAACASDLVGESLAEGCGTTPADGSSVASRSVAMMRRIFSAERWIASCCWSATDRSSTAATAAAEVTTGVTGGFGKWWNPPGSTNSSAA